MTDIAEQFNAGGWSFTPEVAEVFEDHVRASVPYYDTIQDLVAQVSDWLVPSGGLVADLGASTGVTARRILNRHPGRGIRFALYDEQPAMLEQARRNLAGLAGEDAISYHATRIQEPPLHHKDADLTVCLLTLQFLPWQERAQTLRLAREHSLESGALIVAEKVRVVDSRWAEIGIDLSHDYKAAHGISDSAIRAKARALRGVLRPYPLPALMREITRAGWHSPEVLFRWHTWAVVGAFASPH